MNTSESAPAWPTPVGVIGAGAAGVALARAALACDIDFIGVGTWHPERAAASVPADLITSPARLAERANLVWLAVPDGTLVMVAEQLTWRVGQWVAHLSGSQPASVITDAVAPALAGAFHPLASLSRASDGGAPVNPLAGHVLGIDGPPEMLPGLSELAKRLGGRALIVPAGARPAYHLAASLASNALVALVDLASAVWSAAGLDGDLALPALPPLIASTQANLAGIGLPGALTGPIARGDVETVRRHLATLDTLGLGADADAIYRLLGRRAVEIARSQGRADPAVLDAINELLK